ncbi:MAG: twin-arginine translocation signal domain-containing protein [Planctomycetota bacterium]
MPTKMNRRSFVKKSALASAATVAGLSFQEQALSAKTSSNKADSTEKPSNADMPMGRIGQVKISRLMIGSRRFDEALFYT